MPVVGGVEGERMCVCEVKGVKRLKRNGEPELKEAREDGKENEKMPRELNHEKNLPLQF